MLNLKLRRLLFKLWMEWCLLEGIVSPISCCYDRHRQRVVVIVIDWYLNTIRSRWIWIEERLSNIWGRWTPLTASVWFFSLYLLFCSALFCSSIIFSPYLYFISSLLLFLYRLLDRDWLIVVLDVHRICVCILLIYLLTHLHNPLLLYNHQLPYQRITPLPLLLYYHIIKTHQSGTTLFWSGSCSSRNGGNSNIPQDLHNDPHDHLSQQ